MPPPRVAGVPDRKPDLRTSVRALSLHAQIRVEELQSGGTDVLVQLGPIHARSVGAGLRIIIPPNLVTLIVEDLVANLTWKHVELRMRYISSCKFGILLGRRCGVTGTDNDIGRNGHLAKPRLVHTEPLNVTWSHRKSCLDSIVAHVKGWFRVKAHLFAQIRRHHLVVLPTALILQKQVGIDLGATDPERGKSTL